MTRGLHALIPLLALAAQAWAATVVVVNGTASHPIPSTLYGQMFEVCISIGDGGLYAELLQNRAFQQVTAGTSAALTAWSAVGDATIAVLADSDPVSSALPNSLQLTIPSASSGSVGFANSGYFGWCFLTSHSWTYNASFFFKVPTVLDTDLVATVALQTSSGSVLAASNVTIPANQTSWTQAFTTLAPASSASDASNLFTVTVDGASAAGAAVNFAMFSLMPPTFKGRANGMRIDVAEALAAMGPTFFRLPGGNNLEGETIATRWQWNATVGPLVDRPGRVGDWGYVNTDGLGLLEYLLWCEDVGMEPILAVWSGYALGGEAVSEGDLAPYIQQAIDQINFVIGDPSTSAAAAQRSSLGHPEPFILHHVEIGNEDFVGSASSTYASYRWRDFFGNLSATFPQLRFLATTRTTGPVLTPKPEEYDVHVYQTPSWFATNAFIYDSFARDGTLYFEVKYRFNAPDQGRLLFPTMQGAAGEAAFMTGLERNSDIVFAASYAPLLQNVASTQWTPDLVSYDALNVYLSTSYYVQKLFSLNRGDEYLPSTLPSSTGTLHWSVTRRVSTSEILFKISNAGPTAQDLSFQLPFRKVARWGTAEVLTGPATGSNTPTTAVSDLIVPVKRIFAVEGKTVNFTAPAFSVSILTVVAH
ncbi:glycoside hydrolase family 51 protein [Punctularia strigosozonata HHB-11173 SS5]|uniref:glycoside hydrolase family 51 protein n=1 Tax=Punctularia strigosozonata (strain HHB-11173) TaxID=741275 RepID=UPI000441673D|nr:glycoside hydrolase family 51 protein [Punctularia strigosozonata HHB-11173 SS5]EIN08778.1 glycoside hydrolase family 51 protein [Punctularia strigosozonata HHB-11173 SS5]